MTTTETSNRYPPIAEYALIGDCESAALVSTDGSVDWLCLPHFDSPALFLKILDAEKGGYCAVHPHGDFTRARRYLPDTGLLETVFRTASGRLTLTDFMRPAAAAAFNAPSGRGHSAHSLVRLLECTLGAVEAAVELKITPAFATETPRVTWHSRRRLRVQGEAGVFEVQTSFDLTLARDGVITGTPLLRDRESAFLVLTALLPGAPAPGEIDVGQLKAAVERYWVDWMARFQYTGPHRAAVARSAITLKLLTFAHSGAIIAAPTTSLPEEIGGVRNWDYRYTWLRDSTFTLMALLELGFYDEAHAYIHFLAQRCREACERFRILYTIRGEQGAAERILSHLEGYRGSRPVRAGNGAAEQKQLDVYGEVIHAIYLYTKAHGWERYRESFRDEIWPTVRRIGDYVAAHWREPDSGIWEVRGGERQFVHSKGMCYAALACALMLAGEQRIDGDFTAWKRECLAARDYLLHDGFNARLGAFTQSVGSEALDAAVLRFPLLGVIDANDPRMRSTVRAIERQLMRNGLVYRYRDAEDGVAGGEATFAICTFWLVGNYVLQGRLAEAEALFERTAAIANDVGLLAEEIDPVTGAQLGNFPQGFTHIGLINAAARIAAARRGEQPLAQHLIGTDVFPYPA